MELSDFIANLEAEFEDLNQGLEPQTILLDIPGWSSMHILLLVAMVDIQYQVLLSGEDLKSCKTVNDLFHLVKSKRGSV